MRSPMCCRAIRHFPSYAAVSSSGPKDCLCPFVGTQRGQQHFGTDRAVCVSTRDARPTAAAARLTPLSSRFRPRSVHGRAGRFGGALAVRGRPHHGSTSWPLPALAARPARAARLTRRRRPSPGVPTRAVAERRRTPVTRRDDDQQSGRRGSWEHADIGEATPRGSRHSVSQSAHGRQRDPTPPAIIATNDIGCHLSALGHFWSMHRFLSLPFVVLLFICIRHTCTVIRRRPLAQRSLQQCLARSRRVSGCGT